MELPLSCAKCGAENRTGAEHCWQCFAPLGDQSGSPLTPRPAPPPAMAPARPASATRVTPVPRVAAPMQQTYRGPRIGQYATSFETASSSRGASAARRIVSAGFRLVFVALLAAGGWFGYRLANDFLKPDFPGTIGGIPKTLDSGAGGLQGPIGRWAGPLHLKTRSQVYSSAIQDNQDAFVVMKVTGWSGRFSPDELLADLVNSGSQLKVPAKQVQHERIGAIEYSCLTGKDMATRCLWNSDVGEVVIVVSGPSRTYEQVVELTGAAHDSM